MNIHELKKIIKEIVESELYDSPEGADAMQQSYIHGLIENMDQFTKSYIQAALWSSTNSLADGSSDNPMDKNYTITDFEPDTLEKMVSDCNDFQRKYKSLYESGGWSDDEAGHDFWLTRNGHGTGFWDRGYNDFEKERIGNLLTKASKEYGTFDLYIGDGKYDGLICGTPL